MGCSRALEVPGLCSGGPRGAEPQEPRPQRRREEGREGRCSPGESPSPQEPSGCLGQRRGPSAPTAHARPPAPPPGDPGSAPAPGPPDSPAREAVGRERPDVRAHGKRVERSRSRAAGPSRCGFLGARLQRRGGPGLRPEPPRGAPAAGRPPSASRRPTHSSQVARGRARLIRTARAQSRGHNLVPPSRRFLCLLCIIRTTLIFPQSALSLSYVAGVCGSVPLSYVAGVCESLPLSHVAGVCESLPLSYVAGVCGSVPLSYVAGVCGSVPLSHVAGVGGPGPLSHVAGVCRSVPLSHVAGVCRSVPLSHVASVCGSVPLSHVAGVGGPVPLSHVAGVGGPVPLSHVAGVGGPVLLSHVAGVGGSVPFSYVAGVSGPGPGLWVSWRRSRAYADTPLCDEAGPLAQDAPPGLTASTDEGK
ncbi:uncharacterized protein [Canis lupus baileyi]|uniref:uncharacterized protein n=1 Tax=Canis lupus baileyi TaxID=143281 RepID=UPI003B97B1D8